VLIWDHLAFTWGMPAADPWVSLGAAAVSDGGVLLGTGVTPVARRRPQVLAHELRDARDGGAGPGVIFGAASAAATASSRASARTRASTRARPSSTRARRRRGAAVRRAGEAPRRALHGRRRDAEAGADPRIPIWIGGMSTKARARAQRFDGWFAGHGERD
jgi:alkanesulfonate monooxygenase SsuD/methylene tetrahydromethanopterin reductase-like flavin-dependent oxidoreductase (luciferase family)